MKDYTVDDPKFSKKITITEITDTNHADNINKAPKQVFENTLFLEKSKVSANGGDVSDTIIQSAAAVEDEYPIPVAGDTPKTLLGKTKKFFESIKNWMTGVCLLGHIVNNCVTDRSDLPLSAAQGKALMDLYNVLNTKTFLDYSNLDRIFEASVNSIKNITFESDGWVIAYTRTQKTPGTPFIRIASNGSAIYEGFSPTGSYRYVWTPLFPVKRETQLSFNLQVGEGIDDGQIGILFLRE